MKKYYISHCSDRLGSEWSHVVMAKSDRGVFQALNFRLKHWHPGVWEITTPTNGDKPYGETRKVGIVYKRSA